MKRYRSPTSAIWGGGWTLGRGFSCNSAMPLETPFPFVKGKLEDLVGGGTSSSLSPLVCLSGPLSVIREVGVSIGRRESGCRGILSARDGDKARLVLEAAGDGIACMSRELGPLLNGLIVDLDFFSGVLVNSVGFVLCRRPIMVPSLLKPLKPPCRRSGPI